MARENGAFTLEDLQAVIDATAEKTASKIYMENVTGQVNYYRIMERVLYNYKKLKKLVQNEREYLTVEMHSRSKSVVVASSSGTRGVFVSDEEIAEEVARERLANYERTAANLHEVEKVINMFRDEKQFIVIQMYYFNEDADGNEREAGAPQYTWEDIALELAERGILKDEKTARRWRNNLINDMAIVMFGKTAAISTGVFRGKIL